MKRLPILILIVTSAFAAEAAAVRTFPLKYATAEQVRKLFSSFSYPMSANREFNVLTVTAPAAFLTQVEAAVKQYDVAPAAPKNIELTVYLLAAADAGAPNPLPKELQESPYKALRLADSQVIRTRPGQPADVSGPSGISQVRLRAGWINIDEKGSHVSLDGLRVQLKTTTISADIDLHEGQVALIGKAGPDGLVVAMAKVSE